MNCCFSRSKIELPMMSAGSMSLVNWMRRNCKPTDFASAWDGVEVLGARAAREVRIAERGGTIDQHVLRPRKLPASIRTLESKFPLPAVQQIPSATLRVNRSVVDDRARRVGCGFLPEQLAIR